MQSSFAASKHRCSALEKLSRSGRSPTENGVEKLRRSIPADDDRPTCGFPDHRQTVDSDGKLSPVAAGPPPDNQHREYLTGCSPSDRPQKTEIASSPRIADNPNLRSQT